MNYYSTNAEQLAEQYNRLDPAQVHGHWLQHLPATPGMACDIGAGTGRDANWLAEKGWHVTAVEPCKALREISKSSSNANVTWLDDTLPEIKKLRALNNQYNLILISAVWMHIPPGQEGKTRERAFRILTDLLAPGGIIIFTLRHSSNTKASEKENAARGFYPVSADELEHFAKQRAVAALACHKTNDQLKRSHVTWETLVFKLPDDGTGSLPLLRHIIVNDNKSATYKLGLIRALIRIAEGAPGMVLKRTDDAVTIPFGLVALYWLKLYIPLVLKHNIIQAPKANHADQSGYGWANENFWQLAKLSGNDLRIGAAFTGDDAKHIKGALARACENIQKMPAHFITWPGTSNPIFEGFKGTEVLKYDKCITLAFRLVILGELIDTGFGPSLDKCLSDISPNPRQENLSGAILSLFFSKTSRWAAEAHRIKAIVSRPRRLFPSQRSGIRCHFTSTRQRQKRRHWVHCLPLVRMLLPRR